MSVTEAREETESWCWGRSNVMRYGGTCNVGWEYLGKWVATYVRVCDEPNANVNFIASCCFAMPSSSVKMDLWHAMRNDPSTLWTGTLPL